MKTKYARRVVQHGIWLAAGLVVLVGAVAGNGAPAFAEPADFTFNVNSTDDLTDADPGDDKCETVKGNNVCTLRAAVMESNARYGRELIYLEAQSYKLEIDGADDTAAKGDLDVQLGVHSRDELGAMADAFSDRLEQSHAALTGAGKLSRGSVPAEVGKRVEVAAERRFTGLDAYKHAIDAGRHSLVIAANREQAAVPGVAPVLAETLRARLLAVNDLGLPFQVREEGPGGRLVDRQFQDLQLLRQEAAHHRPQRRRLRRRGHGRTRSQGLQRGQRRGRADRVDLSNGLRVQHPRHDGRPVISGLGDARRFHNLDVAPGRSLALRASLSGLVSSR